MKHTYTHVYKDDEIRWHVYDVGVNHVFIFLTYTSRNNKSKLFLSEKVTHNDNQEGHENERNDTF